MAEFEAVFEAVDRSVQQAFDKWALYRQLFDSGEENIALLNSSGSYLFLTLQRLLLDDMILALARLTDSAGSAKRKNASVKYLFRKAKPTLSTELATEVEESLAKLDKHVKDVRVHRNKEIAHSDLQDAVGALAVPDIAYADLEGAMKELSTLMCRLGTASIRRVGGYRAVFAFGTDGNKLLEKLRQASGDRVGS